MLPPIKERISEPAYLKPTWLQVLSIGILLATPFVIGNFLFSAYQRLDYRTLADVQGTSILFIGLFMAVVVLSVVSLKEYHTRLYMTYNLSNGIFWLSLFLLVPVLWIARTLISGTHAQQFSEIVIRASIASVVFVLIATFGVALLAYMLEKLAKKKPV